MAEDKLQLFNMPSNVKGQVLIYNNVYVLCKNSIHKIQTGNMIDINNKYKKVPSSSILIIENGANKKIINDIWHIMQKIQLFELNDKNKENIKIRQYCCDINMNLLNIINDISNFITNYETLRSIYYRELAKTQKITTEEIIIDHPFIPNLDNIVKNIIVDNIGGLLNKLTQLIINAYILELSNSKIEKIMSNDKNLNQALEVLYKNNLIHKNSELRTFVDNSYRKFLTRLIKIRNKMEHSSKKQNVEIINFYIQPNSSWGNPYWIINIPDYQGNYFLIDELECIYLDFINFIQEFIQIFIKEKFRF